MKLTCWSITTVCLLWKHCLDEDNRSPDRDLNARPPEYKAAVLSGRYVQFNCGSASSLQKHAFELILEVVQPSSARFRTWELLRSISLLLFLFLPAQCLLSPFPRRLLISCVTMQYTSITARSTKLVEILSKHLFLNSRIDWLKLFKEITAVYSDNHMKLINIFCGQHIELLFIKINGIYSNHWSLKR
jgi:hypothetical protein